MLLLGRPSRNPRRRGRIPPRLVLMYDSNRPAARWHPRPAAASPFPPPPAALFRPRRALQSAGNSGARWSRTFTVTSLRRCSWSRTAGAPRIGDVHVERSHGRHARGSEARTTQTSPPPSRRALDHQVGVAVAESAIAVGDGRPSNWRTRKPGQRRRLLPAEQPANSLLKSSLIDALDAGDPPSGGLPLFGGELCPYCSVSALLGLLPSTLFSCPVGRRSASCDFAISAGVSSLCSARFFGRRWTAPGVLANVTRAASPAPTAVAPASASASKAAEARGVDCGRARAPGSAGRRARARARGAASAEGSGAKAPAPNTKIDSDGEGAGLRTSATTWPPPHRRGSY